MFDDAVDRKQGFLTIKYHLWNVILRFFAIFVFNDKNSPPPPLLGFSLLLLLLLLLLLIMSWNFLQASKRSKYTEKY